MDASRQPERVDESGQVTETQEDIVARLLNDTEGFARSLPFLDFRIYYKSKGEHAGLKTRIHEAKGSVQLHFSVSA